MISFQCPTCQTSAHVDELMAGQKIACPGCGQRLRVPAPQDRTIMGELVPPSRAALQSVHSTPAISATSVIRCVCPHCQATIKADGRKAGTRVACPRCRLQVEIPVPRAEVLEEVTSAPPRLMPAPIQAGPTPLPTPAPYAVDAEYGPRAVEPHRNRPPSHALLICGLAIVLAVGLCTGLGIVYLVNANRESKEAEVLKLKNHISAIETQMQALDIEYQAAVSQGNRYRAITSEEQIAAKYEEQAILFDTLATKLPAGAERDDCTRAAADRRANAQRCRLQAAALRSSP